MTDEHGNYISDPGDEDCQPSNAKAFAQTVGRIMAIIDQAKRKVVDDDAAIEWAFGEGAPWRTVGEVE